MFKDYLIGLTQLLFPDNCLMCKIHLNGSRSHQLCDGCLAKITLNTPPFCIKCSRHLNETNSEGLCPSCLNISPNFDVSWSSCLYTETLAQLIHSYKYHGKTSLRKTFGNLMINFIETYHIPMHQFDLVIPIPLHPVRFRERGYNQAELLSQMIAQKYHLTHQTNILKRVKFTQSQTMLEAKQRWTNVHEAFKIYDSKKIADKNILIVDDLLTTAATTNAASQTLKEAGAAFVGVLTLSITP